MKITVIIIVLILVLIIAMLFMWGFVSRSGQAPGLLNGQLKACPDKSNCVCSEVPPEQAAYVAPIELNSKDTAQAWLILKTTISEQGGQIKVEKDDYLAAIFASAVFGFVDDLEARLDVKSGLIHLRSASRVGRSDLGANRQRIKLLKEHYMQNMIAL